MLILWTIIGVLAAFTIVNSILLFSGTNVPETKYVALPGPKGDPGESFGSANDPFETITGVLNWNFELPGINSAFNRDSVLTRFRGIKRSDGTVTLNLSETIAVVDNEDLPMYSNPATPLPPLLRPPKMVEFPITGSTFVSPSVGRLLHAGFLSIYPNGDMDVHILRDIGSNVLRGSSIGTGLYVYGGFFDTTVTYNVRDF